MKNRVGEINYNKFGSKMEIVAYRGANDIDIYFEEYDCIVKNKQYKNFKIGNIRCPYNRNKYNGFLGEGKYNTKENGKKTKCYQTWFNMLIRCYDDEYKNKKTTYKDATVCEEWHNFQNFAKWYEENYYGVKDEEMQLDKDILIKGNKIYSPQTCVFVPKRINDLFVDKKKNRGDCPIGVSYSKMHNLYKAEVTITKNKKAGHIFLGLYNTKEEAFYVYKQYKENIIKQVADEYRPYIPRELYEAMYRWEVDIND